MTDALDLQWAITAAETALAAGNLAGAEACLRRAVELEEAESGEAHPALPESLNNLGIVCERLDKPAEAERCYRRAYAIAAARLAPDHPAVATSAENLRAFCAARGLAFEPAGTPELPPPAVRESPAPAATPEPAVRATVPEAPAPTPAPAGVRPARSQSSRRPAMALVAVAALLVVAVVGMFVRSRTEAPPPGPAPADAPVGQAAADPVEPPPTRVPAPARSPAPTPPAATRPRPAVPTGSPARPAPAVLTAELCRSLETSGGWHCAPVNGTVKGGVVYFFTRLASTADTTVQHRWYQDGHLRQAVTLHVGANPAGFRTYSRFTATPARAGRWRVEVRSADGAVLGEREFTVEP